MLKETYKPDLNGEVLRDFLYSPQDFNTWSGL